MSAPALEHIAQDILLRHPLIVLFTILCAVVAAGYVTGKQQPTYRASAKIVLEDSGGSNPLLESLTGGGGGTESSAATAMLRTRRIAKMTVAPRSDGLLGVDPGRPLSERTLGLATEVIDESRTGLNRWTDRFLGRARAPMQLYASVDEKSVNAPPQLRVQFLSPAQDKLSIPGGLGKGEGPSRTFDWRSGETLEWRGTKLRLHPEGPIDDRCFLVTHISEDAAIERLLGNLRVSEVGKNSGILQVTVDDRDPARAAAIANAICLNYLDVTYDRDLKQASATVDYIEEQLKVQEKLLLEAEKKVGELQRLYPEALNISFMATTLMEQRTALDLECTRLAILRNGYEEAIAALDAEDYAAFSRLGRDLDDPMTMNYLNEITKLHSEFRQSERSDRGMHFQQLRDRLEVIRGDANTLDQRIASMSRIVRSLDEGDTSVLSRLFSKTEPGATGVVADKLTGSYIETIAKLRTEQAELSGQFTEEHPRVKFLAETLPQLEVRVHEHLNARLEGLVAERQDLDELIETRERLIQEWPEAEQGKIEESITTVGKMAMKALQRRWEALRSQERSLMQSVNEFDTELAALPEKELQLADPLRQRASLTKIVALLLTKKQEAEIARAGTPKTADLFDNAAAPRGHVSPRLAFSLLVAAAIGLILGLAFALLKERLLGLVDSDALLEEAAALSVLASLPTKRLSRKDGEITRSTGDSPLRDDENGESAAALRSLRSRLARDARDLNTLAIVSAKEREGASDAVIGLALSYALVGRKTLIVDADMRHPVLHQYFEVGAGPGLAEALDGRRHWRQCTQS
ncbi:MAG: GNVR domain-containing protein, partial [Planctomycetota bacterium]